MMHATSTSNAVMWNGPVCTVCGTRYLGSHKCRNEDILRRVSELLSLIETTSPASERNGLDCDPMRGCPCRPENGGSGVCGCVLGGPKVTC